MGTITWLHLSDFHFRATEQNSWDENIVLKALLVDVAERIEKDGLQPDFVAVTGDIAYSGKSSEYELARRFFDDLLQTTGLAKDRLFLVPGNHDVDRNAISPLAAGATAILDSHQTVNRLLANDADRSLVLQRFHSYCDFINQYLALHLSCDAKHYFYVRMLNLEENRIAILGLNSAWLAASDADRNRLLLGERQVRDALAAAQGADLCLALMHHPFEWLRDLDRSDVGPLLCDGCDFVLHGHMHKVGLLRALTPDTEAMLIAAGACYETREHPNSYNIVQFDPEKGTGTVFLRMYSHRRGGFWTEDVVNYRNTSAGQYAFDLGRKPQPEHPASKPARLFICYKRSAEPDQKLAQYLYDLLTAQGHDAFIDNNLRAGEAWLDKIDQQIKASDFLIVLLSKESADSEMVQAEVRRAYEYRQLQGHPHTLPVRIAYEGLLPYSIAAFLDPFQYLVWQSNVDDERMGRDILAAIGGCLPRQAPVKPSSVSERVTVSDDGRIVADDGAWHPPLPEFDPRFLEELVAPGGALAPSDKFYITREADGHLRREVVKSGTTTTIRAPRQTGKSSLLVRGIHHASRASAKVVSLDIQRVHKDYLVTLNVFLCYLAEAITQKLQLDAAEVERSWHSSLGPQDKITSVMEDYILPTSDTLVVLAMDEVDRLLQTAFYKDFFALIRSWFNNRALDDRWRKLNIAMVISTEPHLLIPDVNQSPFNVGLKLYLEDFDETQVRDLNWRHSSPVEEKVFPQFMRLLSGHPYLTRKALYTLVIEQLSWNDLIRVAATDRGPFGDHLRHYHWLLRDEPTLQDALKQIIRRNRCPDKDALLRLQRAGLVREDDGFCRCRCDLYRKYFEGKLR